MNRTNIESGTAAVDCPSRDVLSGLMLGKLLDVFHLLGACTVRTVAVCAVTVGSACGRRRQRTRR
ncbi:MAG: hypothetical protein RBS80_26940 [Thermoguttaceae bacterium]|nr:hypothetical protein [Thermoguttaceae bacterium]